MKIPNGVTGFHNLEVNLPPLQADEKLFRKLCFNIAAHHNGEVISVGDAQYPANFYCAQIEFLDCLIYVLLNKYYPYIAFASQIESGNIVFLEHPVLKEQFSPYYEVLDTVHLNALYQDNPASLSELSEVELEQISYWEPETIGQIIFNCWD